MRRFAPLLTLLAVVVLGGALFTLNVVNIPANSPARHGRPRRSPLRRGPAHPRPRRDHPAAAAPAVVEKAYTGRSAGNEVTVAIAVKNGKAVAYACDGKKIEAWLEGTLPGRPLAHGQDQQHHRHADDKASFGTVTVDGKEWPFSAKGVAHPPGCTRAAAT